MTKTFFIIFNQLLFRLLYYLLLLLEDFTLLISGYYGKIRMREGPECVGRGSSNASGPSRTWKAKQLYLFRTHALLFNWKRALWFSLCISNIRVENNRDGGHAPDISEYFKLVHFRSLEIFIGIKFPLDLNIFYSSNIPITKFNRLIWRKRHVNNGKSTSLFHLSRFPLPLEIIHGLFKFFSF